LALEVNKNVTFHLVSLTKKMLLIKTDWSNFIETYCI